MHKSIRSTFFIYMMSILLISLVLMGALQAYVATTYFQGDKKASLGRIVDLVSEKSRQDRLGFAETQGQLMDYVTSLSGSVMLVADTEGKVTFGTGDGSEEITGSVPPDLVKTILENGSYTEQNTMGGLFKKAYFTQAAPLYGSDGEIKGIVIASVDASGLGTFLASTMTVYVATAIVVLLGSFGIIYVVTRSMIVPIKHLNNAAQKFGEGNYTVRVPVEGDNELTQLAITFNEMAASFETTDAYRSSFMGNIAHELRTPMTTIKGFVDGMLDGTIPPELQGKYLSIVSEEVGRLARLTQNMLDISRLEVGEYSPTLSNFNMWECIDSVFTAAGQRIEDKKVHISGLKNENAVWVLADRDFVHQVLFNLLDNAIKFSPEGGEIIINVSVGKSAVTVALRNSGGEIPANVLPYIFDRFYKADESRGMNTKGSGLGLHICKVLLNLMGGRIWASGIDGEWTEFAFNLPMGTGRRV